MLKNETFIVFGEDYGRHPHCLEHIVNELLKHNTIIWVETIGMRSPRFTFYDAKRAVQIIGKWIFGRKKKKLHFMSHNITIISPIMLPYTSLKIVRRINQFIVNRKVYKEIRRNGLILPILITSIPSTCDFVKIFKEKLTVYYCVDEFSLWPGIPPERVRNMENELIEKSDLIFASSSSLAMTKNIPGKDTFLLTHGVDLSHFYLGPRKTSRARQRTICYFGLIDERCDQELISHIAHSIPDCIVTIIGNVVVRNLSPLLDCRNIVFESAVSYQLLPERIKDQDLFILPYLVNQFTNNINPLKLKEYLATGRPVVSTALPEVIKLSDYLFIGRNHEEFVNVLQGLMSDSIVYSSGPTLKYLAEKETWTAKAMDFGQKIEEILLSKELTMQ